MPHTVLESSATAGVPSDVTPFFIALHRALVATGIVELGRIKGRAVQHANAVVGDVSNAAFVFLQISILDGRTPEQCNELGRAAATVLLEWTTVWGISTETAITIEVREMQSASHQRVLLNS